MKVILDKKVIDYLDKKNADQITISVMGCAS